MHTREMPEDARRRHQEDLGLVIATRRSEPPPPEKRKKMNDKPQQTHVTPSRAQQSLDWLAQPPTFKAVAVYELKRAAVWMPMLISAGAGLLWVNKRFFLPISM